MNAGTPPGYVSRIVKFSPTGKFIKEWGTLGSGPGQLKSPHALAMDTKGRLFVADRGNNRIQIFSQDGKLLDTWSQFGRPVGLWIDKKDTLYVTDAQFDGAEPSGLAQGHLDRQRQDRQGHGLCAGPLCRGGRACGARTAIFMRR